MTDIFPPVVETDRLRLERAAPDAVDVHEFYETFWTTDHADAVFEHVPQDVHAHPRETAALLERAAEAWDDGEHAEYVVRPREGEDGAGAVAGVTVLNPEWDRRRASLGLLLDRPFWGRGYSGERAAALLALAFDRLDLDVVTVDHTVDNDRSRRAVERYVERFGGQRDAVLRNYRARDGTVDDCVQYSVTREGWDEHRPDDHALTVHEQP